MVVLVQSQVPFSIVRLWVFDGPCSNFLSIYKNLIAFGIHASTEFLQYLVVGVFTDPRIDPIIPVVQTANQIVASDVTIGQ